MISATSFSGHSIAEVATTCRIHWLLNFPTLRNIVDMHCSMCIKIHKISPVAINLQRTTLIELAANILNDDLRFPLYASDTTLRILQVFYGLHF